LGDADRAIAKVVPRIADLDAALWDACANPDPKTFDPFVSHAFLKALEDARTVGRGTGWMPNHIVIEDASVGYAGVMPIYAKSHSQGEYVFDHAWADAYERAGGQYYPKLQCAVPFTPVPGRRLLTRPGLGAEKAEQYLASAAVTLAQKVDASSLHITFASEAEWKRLGAMGFLQRTGQQFHWKNEGYGTFDDFLASLASRKRKAIRKERAEAMASGLTIEHVSGSDLTEAHWDAFFEFYIDTGSRKWGHPYLNRKFFSLLGESLGDQCLLVMAKEGGRYIAGALHLIGGDCLYGRYWGAVEHRPFLHFELCYYQAIDIAIAKKLSRAEAGAQGEHKLARGYLPEPTYSMHWIADSGLAAAVRRYLEGEREQVAEISEELRGLGPFRKSQQTDEN
jgi:predicted N-acyltransferase